MDLGLIANFFAISEAPNGNYVFEFLVVEIIHPTAFVAATACQRWDWTWDITRSESLGKRLASCKRLLLYSTGFCFSIPVRISPVLLSALNGTKIPGQISFHGEYPR